MSDLISREAVINLFEEHCGEAWNYAEVWELVEQLPSVQPIRKGHWIITDDDMYVYCSYCGDSYYPRPIDASWYYCPHCGAKMEVSE